MAALALHGLGRSEAEVLNFYESYCDQLEPIEQAPPDYLRKLEIMGQKLAETGVDLVLAEELPHLISGWPRNAFHPLIRLAYGYQFGIAGEIAAGLAYLSWCGPDQTLERLASADHRASGDPLKAFESLSQSAMRFKPDRRFDDRLSAVIEQPWFESVARPYPDALASVSRIALTIFDQTHDFFALHLVTGAHAFRILYPFTGVHRDQVFSLGMLAGYAAVGAPAFVADPSRTDGASSADSADIEQLSRHLRSSNDHDIKLAYSAGSQAQYFQEPAYTEAALRYLGR